MASALAAPLTVEREIGAVSDRTDAIPWPAITLAVIGLRLLLSAVGAATRLLLPQAHQHSGIAALLIAPWRQFDALRFTTIAAHGYGGDSLNTAYLPLYPLLIRAASVITFGHYMSAALLISNLACVAGVGLFWRWVADQYGMAVAWRSVAALLLFPDAFYLLGGYSESLFLALSCGALLAARRNVLLLAGALAALATLTRLQGLVLLIPLAFAVWDTRTARSRLAQGIAGLALPPAALLAYQRILAASLGGGNIVTAFQQRWHITLQAPWSTIWQYVQVIRSPRWHLIDSPQANYVLLWDLVIGLLALAVILIGARRLGRRHTVYALAAWCFALSRWYSTGRYMLAVLPFFIVVGLWTEGRRGRRLSIVSLVFLVFFTAEFAQGSWVD